MQTIYLYTLKTEVDVFQKPKLGLLYIASTKETILKCKQYSYIIKVVVLDLSEKQKVTGDISLFVIIADITSHQ